MKRLEQQAVALEWDRVQTAILVALGCDHL